MTTSPMMQQYRAAKTENPEGILFFRMGDFYEMFYEDAEQASQLLGLTLTSRSKGDGGIPMAGVPARAVDGYINRLVRQGYKVVLCDQIQDPSEAKGLVERAVTRVVTPGTVLEEEGLEEKDHNFLCGLLLRGERAGLASADLSTGTFLIEEVARDELADAALRWSPAECIVPERAQDADSSYATVLQVLQCPLSPLPDWRFDTDEARRSLSRQLGVAKLDGFGVEGHEVALGAAGAVLQYLQETQRGSVAHMTRLRVVTQGETLVLDRTSRASLEVTVTQRDGHRQGSLLWVLDRTLTSMGARRLKAWLLEPLGRVPAIQRRQEGVRELNEEAAFRAALRTELERVQDVDRLIARVSCGRATARELVGLRESLGVLPAVAGECSRAYAPVIVETAERLPDLADLVDLLGRALRDEVPAGVREGGLIREGFDSELDDLRELGADSRAWIARFQAREQERTGIPSLKVGFNKVFGYYIEITHVHAERVPDDYHRKQTLKNAERYITPDLKEYEQKILGAEERIRQMEYDHFVALRDSAMQRLEEIQDASDVLAILDALQSLATAAVEHRYVRPDVDETRDLEIVEGRHPVLDVTLVEDAFVPNDVQLVGGSRELLLITGPNMAGKSTFIRQTALIVLMAQAGSFVPARSARIGVVDRVFTRVGASDELSRGNSTFMTEMLETAGILNNSTDRSLVILDEVGRGTSTFDGLSIAWAITEHLSSVIGCRTLFATHYHELADLADRLPNTCNMNVAVREWGEDIVFLHKIVEGSTDRSYGIHVARLAGLPRAVLDRARDVLDDLEAKRVRAPDAQETDAQLMLFPESDSRLRDRLLETDPDSLTPRAALEFVYALRDLAKPPS